MTDTVPIAAAPKQPTLTIETTTLGMLPQDPSKLVVPEGKGKMADDAAAAAETTELTPTNSSTATMPSPKDEMVSPIAPEVSVETTLSPSSLASNENEAKEAETTKELFEVEAEAKDTSTATATTTSSVLSIAHNGTIRHITVVKDKDVLTTAPEFEGLLKAAFGLDSSKKVVGFAKGDAFITLSAAANGKVEVGAKDDGDSESNMLELVVVDRVKPPAPQMMVTGSPALFHPAEAEGVKGADDEEEDDFFTAEDDDDAKMSLVDFADLVALLVERGGLTASQGNLLFDYAEAEADHNGGLIKGPLKTSYCVAEWAKDATFLCEGLSALCDTIAKDSGMTRDDDYDYDDDDDASCLGMNTIDFLLEASETTFLESLRKDTLSIPSGGADVDDNNGDTMSPENFWALHHAILVSHPAIVAVYEGYKRSLVQALDLSSTLNGGEDIETASAEETEDDCIGSALEFLLHALKRVGQALEPIPMGEEEDEEDEDTAKNAPGRSIITTDGNELDSLAKVLDAVVAPLPESLQVLAYSLLTEGDGYLLEALDDFVRDGDVKQVQEDVLARLQIAVKSMERDYQLIEAVDNEMARKDLVIPKSIVAAAATLVEHHRISDQAATLLVSKVALAEDSSLGFIVDYFNATGDVVTFLQSLELYAAQSDENSLGLNNGQYDRVLAKSMTETYTEMLLLPLEEEEEDDGVFAGEAGAADVKAILQETTQGFTPLEIQALKLATARNDPELDDAILRLQTTGNTLSFTMQLIRVAQDTIAQTRSEMTERKMAAVAMGGFEG